jgi:RNA polymerase sigma factor (TIGR02999 family)
MHGGKNLRSVSQLLADYRGGDREALDRLVPLVYDELHRIAASYISRERAGHTLQPTALVNEAYIRLVQAEDVAFESRAHFLGIAARLMRQILVDHARRHDARRRGGHQRRVTLTEGVALDEAGADVDLLALDQALERLAAEDARLARLVELRYFGGLSTEETAEVLATSPRTVKRDWAVARVWLRRLMSGET